MKCSGAIRPPEKMTRSTRLVTDSPGSISTGMKSFFVTTRPFHPGIADVAAE